MLGDGRWGQAFDAPCVDSAAAAATEEAGTHVVRPHQDLEHAASNLVMFLVSNNNNEC